MATEPFRRPVTTGPDAAKLRRQLGATSWVVLDEMMERSTGDGDHVVAQVSIWLLASSLGLAKDTVARAVRRLSDLGVIEAVQVRASSGVFEAGSYRLAVPARFVSVTCPSQPPAAPSSSRSSLRSFFKVQTGAHAQVGAIMIRVTTLYASGAGVSAAYYTSYLTKADGEQPGVWAGSQARGLGLSREVSTEALEALLSGHHPTTGMQLGRPLEDRVDRHGNTIKAVAGSNGSRLHPEPQGLTVGVFRQSTSRADEPQLHTHVVISSKVQTADGRWYALDALMLKKYQQAFGYLYQSVLRAEVTARYGVVFDPIVNGQAEIAGVPSELLEQFSKRSREIGTEMGDKLADFLDHEGRDPTGFEYAAILVDLRNDHPRRVRRHNGRRLCGSSRRLNAGTGLTTARTRTTRRRRARPTRC